MGMPKRLVLKRCAEADSTKEGDSRRAHIPWSEEGVDPRDTRGVRHGLYGLLALMVAGFASGRTNFWRMEALGEDLGRGGRRALDLTRKVADTTLYRSDLANLPRSREQESTGRAQSTGRARDLHRTVHQGPGGFLGAKPWDQWSTGEFKSQPVLRARSQGVARARRSPESRDPGGMFALGNLLMKTDRQTEGRRWLRKALAHGEGGAACHLGREVEARSPSRALRLYLKRAALGDPFAAFCAGSVLEPRQTRRALLQAEALYKKAVPRIQGADEALERVRRKLKALRGLR